MDAYKVARGLNITGFLVLFIGYLMPWVEIDTVAAEYLSLKSKLCGFEISLVYIQIYLASLVCLALGLVLMSRKSILSFVPGILTLYAAHILDINSWRYIRVYENIPRWYPEIYMLIKLGVGYKIALIGLLIQTLGFAIAFFIAVKKLIERIVR